MKQQQHDINFEEDSEKKSESQMGFEPTTLRDLVLPIFSIYYFFILSFFFLSFFYPRHLPKPTPTTHDLYPLPTTHNI